MPRKTKIVGLALLVIWSILISNIATAQDIAQGGTAYPTGSLGIKTGIWSSNVTSYGIDDGVIMETPVLLEGTFDINSVVGIFIAAGMFTRYQNDEDGDNEDHTRYGAFLLQIGGRFNLMTPRARSAHLYIPVDIAFAFGFARIDNSELNDEQTERAEEGLREQIDRMFIGSGVGFEYLIVPEFGFASEFELRWMYNNLIDTNGPGHDKDINGGLETCMNIRLNYHF